MDSSTKTKIVLASVIIVIALIILVLKFNQDEKEATKLHSEYVPRLTKGLKVNESLVEADILVFPILDSKVCPPCITNVIELFSIVDTTENFEGLDLIFIDDSIEDVEKLKVVTDLNLPHKIFSSKEILKEVNRDVNILLFVDRKTNYVIHSLQIPTKNTSIAQKEFTLQEVIDKKIMNDKRNN